MKLAKVFQNGKSAAAVIAKDEARIISDWTDGDAISAPFDATRYSITELEQLTERANEIIPLADVSLEPPIAPLSKIICLGHNYKAHVDETHHKGGEHPGLFTKVPDALVGHSAPMIRPKISEKFDFEGEIVIVIGKGGRHISRENALDHVFGYTIMMDGSVRDFQKQHSITSGKNFWHSGSVGPWIITSDEIPDPKKMTLETRLSGQQVQSTSAELMIFDVPFTIAYVSQWTPLSPGDIIATGTPGGVGSRREPPLWMKAGDTIEVEVQPIGVLTNPIEDE